MFGNLGFGEMLVILIVGLVVIGPKKLPELARSLGKGLNEFRRAALDLKTSLSVELEDDERRTRLAPPSATRSPATPRADTATSAEVVSSKSLVSQELPSSIVLGAPTEAVARSGSVSIPAPAPNAEASGKLDSDQAVTQPGPQSFGV